jgi:hypothetical protein
MNSPETTDPIDKLLRDQDAYVPDDGFTKRVIAGLPRRKSTLLPRLVLLAAVMVGTVMAIFWMPWGTLPPLDYTQLFQNTEMLSAWLPFVVVGVTLGSAIYSLLRRED